MTDDGPKTGMAAAIEAAIAAAGRGLDLPQELQLPLLPAGEDGDEAADPAEQGRRGPGRPPGARNKRTADMVAYLERRYSSPLEALALVYSRNIKVLAAEMGLTTPTFDQLVELLKLQIIAADKLAPYLHSKKPVSVEVSSRGVVQLVVEKHGAKALPFDDAGGRVIDLVPVTVNKSENDDNATG